MVGVIDARARRRESHTPRGSREVDLFPDGTLDVDDDSLGQPLVIGAFHSGLQSKGDQTERYLATPRLPFRGRR